MYEDAPNYMRIEPQRTHTRSVSPEKAPKGHKEDRRKVKVNFGVASQRIGI